MNTLSFLRLVWPNTGLYLLAVPRSFTQDGKQLTYFKHFAFPTIEQAADAAVQFATDRDTPADVFFAMASVKQDFTALTKKARDEQGVKVRGAHPRTGTDNTASVKAFWFDLDVKADPRAYATQQEAAVALRSFCAAMALPKPVVVSSGGGLHVYWPLTHAVDGAEWVTHAAILKALAASWGLKADPSRTSDVASVLRPVGTFNWKTGAARPVEVLVVGEPTDTQWMLHKLQDLLAATNVQVQPARTRIEGVAPSAIAGVPPSGLIPLASINDIAAAGAGYAKPKASDVVKRCPQLMWQKDQPTQVSEPQWYAMIGCLRFAERGERAIHLLSQGHPSYSNAGTQDKIIQHENSGSGPTLCSTFAMHNPAGCAGCPAYGKIKTPLQNVRDLIEVAPPVIEVETVDGTTALTLPPPPPPFKRVLAPGCDAGRIAIRRDEKDGAVFDEVIYENDLYPKKLTYDEREQSLCVTVCSWLPIEGWSEFNIPTGEFYDRRLLSKRLGSKGVMVDLGKVDEVVQYMVAYIRELQKQAAANVVYAQLGWRDDKGIFVLPDRIVSEQGVEKIEPSLNIVNALSWSEPRGDLEVWKKVVSIYERVGLEGFQFGFGVGLAAPIFKFTNFAGAIVSMVGKRGTGKSSAALCANSIWGHKKMGWMSMDHDTWKAFYGKIGALNNLPATYDEITNLDPDRLSDLAYAITQGQGRQRLQSNGQAQENYGNWNTMMLTTSNSSLHSRLSMAKSDSSAEASRIFEYHLPVNTLGKAEADDNFDLLNDHYGVAAEPYTRALLSQHREVRARVKHWIKEVDRVAGTGSSERFWSAVPAAVLAAFELSNSIGLTNANVQRLFNFAVKQIHTMRGNVTETVRTAESMISDYLNSNMKSMLAINSDAAGKTLAQVTIQPSSDRLRIRLERHTGNLFVDRADFRKFCNEQGSDPRQVESDLRESGVLRRTDAKPVLGKGTIYSTTQTWCWLLDFNNPALSGVVREAIPAVDHGAPTGQVG